MFGTRTPHGCLAELLEARRLLSAQVVDGTLVVTGTAGPDRFHFWEDARGGDVIVVGIWPIGSTGPGEQYDIPTDGVRSVLVRAGAGDDEVDLADYPLGPTTGPLSVPARVDGGIGNDAIYGTPLRDFLSGGFGKDHIIGGDGDDWIDGGWGDDELYGLRGNDVLFGGYGNDSIRGGDGNDRMNGGPGNDRLGAVGGIESNPEPGDDVLAGAGGDDFLAGGVGHDRVSGGTGFDHFSVLDADGTEILDRAAFEPKDAPLSVGANFVTFAFRGTVTRVTTPHGPPPSGPETWPAPGTEFRGTYTFDASGADTAADPNAGVYTTSPAGPVEIHVGDYHWLGPASAVVTHDAPAGDVYEATDWIPSLELVSHPELARFLDRWNFSLRIDGDPGLLDGPALPADPPPLDHATSRTLTLVGDSSTNVSPVPFVVIEATLDELTRLPNT